mmetsp:Transcript_68785/g.164606  ORF Transcript_68785/g.164606 Transcript_68785/m.164606 type:complete len:265 (+) Transcript_68785:159-953(+)
MGRVTASRGGAGICVQRRSGALRLQRPAGRTVSESVRSCAAWRPTAPTTEGAMETGRVPAWWVGAETVARRWWPPPLARVTLRAPPLASLRPRRSPALLSPAPLRLLPIRPPPPLPLRPARPPQRRRTARPPLARTACLLRPHPHLVGMAWLLRPLLARLLIRVPLLAPRTLRVPLLKTAARQRRLRRAKPRALARLQRLPLRRSLLASPPPPPWRSPPPPPLPHRISPRTWRWWCRCLSRPQSSPPTSRPTSSKASRQLREFL